MILIFIINKKIKTIYKFKLTLSEQKLIKSKINIFIIMNLCKKTCIYYLNV